MKKYGPPPGIGHEYPSDEIMVPRAQYEALMGAAKVLERSREWAWSDFEGTLEQFEEHPEVKAIGEALAALRAAGIDLEDGK